VTALLPALAAYLADLELGFWHATDPYPPDVVGISLGSSPAAPDRAVTLATYTPPESNTNEPYDLVNVQIRVRGGVDYMVASDHAQAIYDALQGLGITDLPGGVRIVNSVAQVPVYIGTDPNDRHELTVNVRVEVRNPTALRSSS
jgi:hypothetical protein